MFTIIRSYSDKPGHQVSTIPLSISGTVDDAWLLATSTVISRILEAEDDYDKVEVLFTKPSGDTISVSKRTWSKKHA